MTSMSFSDPFPTIQDVAHVRVSWADRLGYGTAFLAVVGMTLANMLLWPVIHEYTFATYLLVVVLLGLHGGRRPAVFATVLTAAAQFAWFFEPRYGSPYHRENVIALCVFVVIALYIACATDVYPCRLAEQRLRFWYQSTLTSLPDAVIAVDTTGRVLFLNPMAEGYTG